MTHDDSAGLQEAMLAVVDNQMAQNTPPQTRQTIERLVAAGHDRQEARKLVAAVLAVEVQAVMQQGRPFDEPSYVKALQALPRLPWDE